MEKRTVNFFRLCRGVSPRGQERGRLLRYSDILGPWLGVVLCFIVIGSINPRFISPASIASIIVDVSPYILLGVGMTFVITGAGIDLSIGSVMCFSGVVMAVLVRDAAIDPILAMVACLATGVFLGFVNGFVITRLRMPDIIVTLATMIAIRAGVYLWIGHRVLRGFPPVITYLGGARLLDGLLPVSILVAILVVAVSDLLLYKRTKFGRYTIALGGNRNAAIRAGIPVDRYKIYTYMFSGFMAALGAILLIGRGDSWNYMFGTGKEFHVIAGVLVGGTALFGGSGRLWGSLAGMLLISTLVLGMVAVGLSFFWQDFFIAVVIILAVALYTVTGRRQSRGVGGVE